MSTRAIPSGVLAILWIPAITVSVHLLGSAILFGSVSGLGGLLASPLLSIFGWFFLPIEFVAVLLQWSLYGQARHSAENFWVLLAMSVVVGALFMGVCGPKEEGSVVYWTMSYMFAGGGAAAWSLVAIRLAKGCEREREAESADDWSVADRERTS
jgi:hypothetical protein